MKFTLSWLKEYLDTNADCDGVLDKLNQIGLEVEEVIDEGKNLKDFNLEGFFPSKETILSQTKQRVLANKLRFYLERNNYHLVGKNSLWLEKMGEESLKIEVLL